MSLRQAAFRLTRLLSLAILCVAHLWLVVGPSSALAQDVPVYLPIVMLPLSDDMTLVPAGPFQMGCAPGDGWCRPDEFPLHRVRLAAYAIDTYEVTNARYAACVDAGACEPPHDLSSQTRDSYYSSPEYADYPVINVDWFQARIFCRWQGKRLPTEAEWEKAARGASNTRELPWDGYPSCDQMNYMDDDSTWHFCVGDTTAVGSYPTGASPYGALDMSGNVWEWVADWYDSDYYSSSPAANPQGPATGTSRVLRSGAWNEDYGYLRVSNRNGDEPDEWDDDVGFRCACSQ